MQRWLCNSDFFRLRFRWWGLFSAAGTVAGTASVLGFFGPVHWLLDLCSHFRVQYFFGLALVSLLLLIPRKKKSAACFGALALVNLAVLLSLYGGHPPAPPADGRPFRALLCNVESSNPHKDRVVAMLRRYQPDIVVLEEVTSAWLVELQPVLCAYDHAITQPRDDNFGIALFSKYPLARARVVTIGAAGVPSILADVQTPQGRCTLLATHPLPPVGAEYFRLRNGQLAQLPLWTERATSPLLLLGDLNTTPWNAYFRRLLRETRLRDSAQGRGIHPSWPANNPLLRIPLDHALHSDGLAVVHRETGPDVGSDHFPLVVDVVLTAAGTNAAATFPAVNLPAAGH